MKRTFTFLAIATAFVLFFGACTEPAPKAPVAPPAAQNTKPDGTGVLIKKRPQTRRQKAKASGVRTFMHRMGRIESKNNYRAVNALGMLGRYQFDPKTIRAMGFKVTKEEFLSNPSLQDRVMLAFMKDNKRTLKGLIRKYHGKEVHGVPVSASGILAASHLAGVGGVLSWFYPDKYQYKTSDSNGATVAMYMTKFHNIDLSGL